MHPRPSGIITLLTDFGLLDPYVGVMKGAVLRAHPKAVLVDLGHDVAVHDPAAGAFALAAAIDRFPAGTVHVAVVDPGVGTERRMLAASAHESYWLAPDNGLLTSVLADDPAAEVRTIDLPHLRLSVVSRTFHGRDIFAPLAGWLAAGRYGFTAIGPLIEDPLRLADDGGPRIVHEDRFGNLITSVPANALAEARGVKVGGVEIPLCGTYGEVAVGELLALVGSFDRLEIAENCGSAARTLRVGRGSAIELLLR